jgi:S-adenosyl methyltransferase
VRANRAFLARAVRFLAAEAGIRQFLDLGTGIPAAGNTHEVAQSAAPDCRVVYVDHDPVVLRHARALLANADLRGGPFLRRPGAPRTRRRPRPALAARFRGGGRGPFGHVGRGGPQTFRLGT